MALMKLRTLTAYWAATFGWTIDLKPHFPNTIPIYIFSTPLKILFFLCHLAQ